MKVLIQPSIRFESGMEEVLIDNEENERWHSPIFHGDQTPNKNSEFTPAFVYGFEHANRI